MSYRNPKIINDQSGQILAQGISQGVQNISKGIIALGAEQRRNEILQKKEKQNLIKLQNEHSQSSAVFNTGLEGMSASMKAAMIKANEANLTKIDEIKVKQQGGNTDPKLSAELGQLKTQIGSDVEFGKTVIATTTLLQENREQYEKLGKTRFYKEEKVVDPKTKEVTYNTDRAVAIVDGFGGDPAYEADVFEINGVLYARSKNKKTGKIFEIPASEFKTIADDFMIDLPNSAEAVRKSILVNMFDRNGLTGSALSNVKKSNTTDIAADGDQIFYNVQTLDPAYIEKEKNAANQSSLAAIEGTYGNRQAQQIQLVNYGIDPEVYNGKAKETDEPGVANEEQQELIRKRSDQNFDAALEQEGIVINTTTTGEGKNAVTTSSYEKRTKDSTKSLSLTEAQKKINVSNAKFNKKLNDSITAYEANSEQSPQENAAVALNNLFEISGAASEGKKIDINAGKKTYREVKFKTNSSGQLVLNYKTGTKPGEETTGGQGNDSRSETFVIKDIGRLKNLLQNNFKMSEYQLKSTLIRFKNELKMDDSFFTSSSNN